MCISQRCLICSLYQKEAGQRNSGEKFHVSILIMHRPSLQLHTWLISFSLLNLFPVTFMSFAPFGRENFSMIIVSNLGSSLKIESNMYICISLFDFLQPFIFSQVWLFHFLLLFPLLLPSLICLFIIYFCEFFFCMFLFELLVISFFLV